MSIPMMDDYKFEPQGDSPVDLSGREGAPRCPNGHAIDEDEGCLDVDCITGRNADMENDQWIPVTDASPDEGQIVETKIDDANGERNPALLVRRGRLWYFADESMYVYYTPTHYRKPLATDVEKELNRLTTKAGAFEEIKQRLMTTETR